MGSGLVRKMPTASRAYTEAVEVILIANHKRQVTDVPDGASKFVYRILRAHGEEPDVFDMTYVPDPNGTTATHEGRVLPVWVPRMIASGPVQDSGI